jgi:hypothetical protein
MFLFGMCAYMEFLTQTIAYVPGECTYAHSIQVPER